MNKRVYTYNRNMMKFTISYYLNLCYDFLKDVKTMIDYINNTKIFKDGAVETLISSIFIIVFSLICGINKGE